MTVLACLVAKEVDTLGYITYVFECLDKEVVELSKYIMCTRYPNWNHRAIELGEVGYLNFVEIDGEIAQKYLISTPDIFTETIFYENYFFKKGTHTLEILPLHGWISVDYLKFSPTKLVEYENMLNVNYELSNPKASDGAKRLFSYLKSLEDILIKHAQN